MTGQLIDSDKYCRMLSQLRDIALKSNLRARHAAVLMKNGKPIYYGHNYLSGNKTYHAEVAVIRRYLLEKGCVGWVRRWLILWDQKHREKGS